MGTRSNRRAFTRIPIAFRVKILTEDATLASSTALNLSLGGLLVQTSRPLPLGTPCHVVLFVLEDGARSRRSSRRASWFGRLRMPWPSASPG